MNRNLKTLASVMLAAAVSVAYAQPASNPSPSPQHHPRRIKKRHLSVEQQIEELREQMNQQRDEINSLREQLTERNSELRQAQSEARQSQSAAQQAQAASSNQQQQLSDQTQAVTALQSAVARMKRQNANLATVVKKNQASAVKKSELSPLAFQKIKLGVTFYGDFTHYTDTGFGPQFLTQANQPGPGNSGFNSFDITRTYLNFVYTPNSAVSLRVTPNIYRQVDGGSKAISFGKDAAVGASTNGNLTFRLKYAYIQFNHPFKGSKAFGKDVIRIGQTQNPLVDWEEGLYEYRFVNLTPWNYLSLSSTYVGAEINGPIMHNGKEYLDYQFGGFNDTSFHHIEQSDTKQFMERLTWYPTGTSKDRTGFGITEFNAFGYNNKFPDSKSTSTDTFAAIAFYQSHDKKYEIAGEYDYGHNAFSSGNLFSGSGPADHYGLATTQYAPFNDLVNAILGTGDTQQQGFDFFGHAALDRQGKFKLFGMFENFQPNTNPPGTDPIDFNRTVGGLSYQFNHYLTFALDDQNLTYYHGQFNMTPAQLSAISSSLAAKYPNGIQNVVPSGSNAIFLNMQFNY